MRPPRSSHALRLVRNEAGNVGPMFALAAIAAFMITGMAIDYRRAITVRSEMQSAVDAAVVAARNETGQKQISMAQAYFGTNYKGNITQASATFANDNGKLRGTASSAVPTTMSQLLHINNISVAATATATPDSSVVTGTPGGTPCIMVLDPTKSKSMNMISNSNLQAVNCEVHVRSSASTAFYSESASNVRFKKILVKGGATGGSQIKDADGVIAVVANSSEVADDPFASMMPSVTPGECTTANTNKSFSGSVNPGTYCGNTSFSGVTMSGGLYIIRGGTLSISGTTTGQNVSLYFADNAASLSYNGGEGTVLSAPLSGAYRGILMFMPNSLDLRTVTISSVNKQSWTGLVYLPRWDLRLVSLSEWPKMNVALAVNSLYANSLSTVVAPYEWTPWNSSTPVKLPGDQTVALKAGHLTE